MDVYVFIVGLSLFTNATSGHPIAILPKFDIATTLPNGGGILSPHSRVIAFPRVAFKSKQHWSLHDNLDPEWYYVRLIDREVSITGNGGTPPVIPPTLIHLKDACCATMLNIKPEYLPTSTSNVKSIVNIDHGTLTDIKGFAGAAITLWNFKTPPSSGTITITTNAGRELVLDAPTFVVIANLPFAALKDPASHHPGGHDFQAYYLLGEGSDFCAKHPGDAVNDDCEPRGQTPSRPKYLTKKFWDEVKQRILTVDSECSNSQYP